MAGEDLQPFRIDALTMGAPGAPEPSSVAEEAAEDDKDAGYPTLEEICSKKANYQAFLELTARSIEKLQAAPSKAEAAKALKAYEHLRSILELLVELTRAEIQRMKKQKGK